MGLFVRLNELLSYFWLFQGLPKRHRPLRLDNHITGLVLKVLREARVVVGDERLQDRGVDVREILAQILDLPLDPRLMYLHLLLAALLGDRGGVAEGGAADAGVPPSPLHLHLALALPTPKHLVITHLLYLDLIVFSGILRIISGAWVGLRASSFGEGKPHSLLTSPIPSAQKALFRCIFEICLPLSTPSSPSPLTHHFL